MIRYNTQSARACADFGVQTHATGQELAQPATSLTKVQNGSRLREGTRSRDKCRNPCESRRSLDAREMYLDPNRTSSPPIHGSSNTPGLTPVMIPQNSSYCKDLSSKISTSSHEKVAFLSNNVEYGLLYLVSSHTPSQCLVLSNTTRSLIIYGKHISFEPLRLRSSYFLGNQSQEHSGKCTSHAFCPGIRSLKRNCRTMPNTLVPRNRSHWNSGRTT